MKALGLVLLFALILIALNLLALVCVIGVQV